jgi:hypothetical protein
MNETRLPQSNSNRTRKVQRVPLHKLGPHDLHRVLLGPAPEEKIEQLASTLRKGLQPRGHVEVAPDGAVLFGMALVEAARRAGRSELEVVVRQDLDGLNEEAKELEVIDLHLEHGGLNDVVKACCLEYAHGIKHKVPEDRWREYQCGTLEEVVARHLKLSPRSAGRYLSLVNLPLPIRQAFEKRQLRIGLAERVRKLSYEIREAIAEAIAGGADPREVVARHVRGVRKRSKAFSVQLNEYVGRLQDAQADLPDCGGRIVHLTAGQQEVLRQAAATATGLLERCQTVYDGPRLASREALLQRNANPPHLVHPSPGLAPPDAGAP